MNRRAFFASLVALPVLVAAKPQPKLVTVTGADIARKFGLRDKFTAAVDWGSPQKRTPIYVGVSPANSAPFAIAQAKPCEMLYVEDISQEEYERLRKLSSVGYWGKDCRA